LPEQKNSILFPGLSAVDLDDFGGIVLKWQPAQLSLADQVVKYQVYMAPLGAHHEVDNLTGEPKPLVLSEHQMPRVSGRLLDIVMGNTYRVNEPLDEGEAYAFQVTALSGQDEEGSGSIFALRYQKRIKSTDVLAI